MYPKSFLKKKIFNDREKGNLKPQKKSLNILNPASVSLSLIHILFYQKKKMGERNLKSRKGEVKKKKKKRAEFQAPHETLDECGFAHKNSWARKERDEINTEVRIFCNSKKIQSFCHLLSIKSHVFLN